MTQKVLMCSPKYFSVAYEINPWMKTFSQIDKKEAYKQWLALVQYYKSLGTYIELISPRKEFPDMVFTANAGLVYQDIFFPSNFRYRERGGERKFFTEWFKSKGYKIVNIPANISFEGCGDALFCGNKLFVGYGFRTDKKILKFLSKYIKGPEIIPLGLSNPYFYHLDTCFLPLPNGQFVYYPDAFDDESRLILERYSSYEVTEEFCVNYGCNLVAIGKILITTFNDYSLKDICQKDGLSVKVLKMDEFIKSGGGVRCLTLFL